MDPIRDPRFTAALDLLRRTGTKGVNIRYQDDLEPTVWIVDAAWSHELARGHDAAAGMDPLQAAMRLLDQVIDGGTCRHCGRVSGVSDDWEQSMPLDEVVCWYVYDPELKSFRRGCEGDTTDTPPPVKAVE